MIIEHKKYLDYYIQLNSSFLKFFLSLNLFFSKIDKNKLYCEHSINYKDNKINFFRGLICITNLNINDLMIFYKVYFILISDKNILSILKNKLIYENKNRFEFWFDLSHNKIENNRYKFYYIDYTIQKYLNMKCNYVIVCYDYFFDWRMDIKKYFVFEWDILKNNLKIFQKKFSKIYSLFFLTDRVNIAFKEKESKVTLDFKIINGDFLFIKELCKKNKNIKSKIDKILLNYNITFIAIKYDFTIKDLVFDDFTIYFK